MNGPNAKTETIAKVASLKGERAMSARAETSITR
jgi:hypothetical protein